MKASYDHDHQGAGAGAGSLANARASSAKSRQSISRGGSGGGSGGSSGGSSGGDSGSGNGFAQSTYAGDSLAAMARGPLLSREGGNGKGKGKEKEKEKEKNSEREQVSLTPAHTPRQSRADDAVVLRADRSVPDSLPFYYFEVRFTAVVPGSAEMHATAATAAAAGAAAAAAAAGGGGDASVGNVAPSAWSSGCAIGLWAPEAPSVGRGPYTRASHRYV